MEVELKEEGYQVIDHRFNELSAALAKAQMVMKHPSKRNKAGSGSFSYTYADLAGVIDVVKEAFGPNGLSFSQFPSVNIEAKIVSVKTRIMHASGQYLESEIQLVVTDAKAQTIGSAITYARRYALSAMAGVAAEEDDDGSVASDKKNVTFQRRK